LPLPSEASQDLERMKLKTPVLALVEQAEHRQKMAAIDAAEYSRPQAQESSLKTPAPLLTFSG